MTARFRVGSATDVGQVRSSNQDSCLPLPGEHTDDLFVVADGMGGHNGGEVASRLAIDTVVEQFVVPTSEALVDAVQAANDALIATADADESLRGMGTTLVALAVVVTDGEERLAVANVGDSRCYLLERDRLRQVTKDHSVVQTLVDNGQITKAEAEHHPQRNILTRALGIDARVMTDSWELLPFAGDRYLLCSDGVFNEVGEAEIAEVLRHQPEPADAAAELVTRANAGGGRDNITAVVVDVVEDGGRHAEAAQALSRVAAYTSGGHRAVATAGTVIPRAGPSDEGAPPSGEGGGWDDEDEDEIKRKGPSYRLIAFVSVLIAVAVVVIGSVLFASQSAYFVGFDGDTVAIFAGSPDGLFGSDPAVKERTSLTRAEVPPSYIDELEAGEEFSSLDDAREYVDRMEQESAQMIREGINVVVPPTTAETVPPDTVDTTDTTAVEDDGTTPPTADGTTPTTEDGGGIGRD
jgi:serine/threonine protein phosphatase PrpC